MAELPDNDEFYTGYLPEAPSGVAKHVRRFTLALLLLAAVSAALLATSQRPFDVAFFEFGAPREFTGTVVLDPYPMLRVERPDTAADPRVVVQGDTVLGDTVLGDTAQEMRVTESSSSHYYVVAFGKFGARQALEPFAGQRVRLQGTLIYRDDQTMLELVDGSVEPLAADSSHRPQISSTETYDKITLQGEIVDSKCYLGVMKPGHHKPHRACASLCIRGGIPPLFVPYADAGPSALPTEHLLLVGPDRQALGTEVLDWVAEPVEISGQVHRMDDVWMFQADPQSFRRIAKD